MYEGGARSPDPQIDYIRDPQQRPKRLRGITTNNFRHAKAGKQARVDNHLAQLRSSSLTNAGPTLHLHPVRVKTGAAAGSKRRDAQRSGNRATEILRPNGYPPFDGSPRPDPAGERVTGASYVKKHSRKLRPTRIRIIVRGGPRFNRKVKTLRVSRRAPLRSRAVPPSPSPSGSTRRALRRCGVPCP